MKQSLVILILFFTVASCNNKTQNTTENEVAKVIVDTVKTTKSNSDKITKEFILGKFDYKTDTNFVKVNPKYTTKEIYLNKNVKQAFLEMHNAAKTDGVELKIISGTRNFYEQKAIWERKWNQYKNLNPKARAFKILEYSSMPSSSRHHWGTDIDLNSLNNSYFNSGKGLKAYNWLKAHANSFGFYQVYTSKEDGRTGYNLEKWHWSYLPLASRYLEFFNTNIVVKDITGFEGAELAKQISIIENYVNGVDKKIIEYKQ